jgi:hypothetical protein
VFIHRDNPLELLTLQQVDAILFSTRSGGADAPINTWSEAGPDLVGAGSLRVAVLMGGANTERNGWAISPADKPPVAT